MTPIVHITPVEMALQRENARLLQAVRIQSVTVEAQAEEIAKLKADAERFVAIAQWLDPGMYLVGTHTPCDYYDDDTGITTDLQVWRLCVDAAMKESK